MPKQTEFQKVIKSLGIDETNYIKPKKYKFDTVKANTFPMGGYNFMADSIKLPKTRYGYEYLLVVVDLWSDAIDFEQMTSVKSINAVKALQKIISRPYLNLPKASVRTDGGPEFKKHFNDFLEDNKIAHRTSLPYRHKQQANVESANRSIGRILMEYLGNKEQELGRVYKQWTDILPQVREALNKYRLKPDGDPFSLTPIAYNQAISTFKLGDLVYTKYEEPYDINGKKENDTRWRQGDIRWNIKVKREIVKVLNYPTNNRYVVKGLPSVAYVAEELKAVVD